MSSLNQNGYNNSSSHANRYVSLISLTKNNQENADYRSTLYMLSADKDVFNIAYRYVSSDGIDFTNIKRLGNNLDESERLVIDIAHNLFSYNSKCIATPFEISRLNYSLMEKVFDALKIAGGNVDVVVKEDLSKNYEISLDDSRYQENKRIAQMFKSMIDNLEKNGVQNGEPQDTPASLLDKLERAKAKAKESNLNRETVTNKRNIDKNL